LTEKLKTYSHYKEYEQYGEYSFEITACDIVIKFTDKDGKYFKYTFPTDFEKLNIESGFIVYPDKSVTMWFSQHEVWKRESWFFF
jgi:hypothetical protein